MTRLASMIIPLALAALFAGTAQAGDYYERVGDHYKPADGARYSSSCCYKKITKRVTITKTVWVKVPPPPAPKPAKHPVVVEDDDNAVEMPRPAPKPHKGEQVVELGQVFHSGGKCRKAVRVRSRGMTVIVLVTVSCR